MPHRPSLVLIGSDEQFTEQLAALLAPAGVVVEAWPSSEEFLAHAKPRAEACLLVDLQPPGVNHSALLEGMRSRGQAHPVILMRPAEGGPSNDEALPEGVHAVFHKPFDGGAVAALIDAVQSAIRHRTLESARVGPLPSRPGVDSASILERFQSLTVREREIARFVAEGLATKAIAQALGLSTRTVENHRGHILHKLGVGNAAQIARALASLPKE